MKNTNKKNEKMRNLPKVKLVKPTVSKNITAGNKSSNKKLLTITQIAKRAGITAREIRDVVTAVGSVGASSDLGKLKKSKSNLVKQVKEVGAAATKGKKGTTSDLTKKNITAEKPYNYRKGKQR